MTLFPFRLNWLLPSNTFEWGKGSFETGFYLIFYGSKTCSLLPQKLKLHVWFSHKRSAASDLKVFQLNSRFPESHRRTYIFYESPGYESTAAARSSFSMDVISLICQICRFPDNIPWLICLPRCSAVSTTIRLPTCWSHLICFMRFWV